MRLIRRGKLANLKRGKTMQLSKGMWIGAVACVLTAGGVGSLSAQVPGIMNYQGRVAVNGTNFTGTGQFKFALVDGGTNSSRQAVATAFIAGDLVLSNKVTDGGAGYMTPPAVSYSGGGGSGATAHALIGGGAVTSVVRDLSGSGYVSVPAVVIALPPVNMAYQTFWSNGASTVSVSVTKGLYGVLLGDVTVANMAQAIPASVFTNSDVRLRVWFDGGSGLQQLVPDQRLAAAPYALVVPASGIVGKLDDGVLSSNVVLLSGSPSFTGTVTAARFSGNGKDLTNVTSLGVAVVSNANLSAQTLSNTFWNLSGNAGTTAGTQFIGTSDNQPVEIKVNGIRALRLEPRSFHDPNIIGGADNNTVSPEAYGVVIGGGSYNSIQTNASNSVISGGYGNSIQTNAFDSVISGGSYNSIQTNSSCSVIGGGFQNSIRRNALYSVIGGGFYNSIQTNSSCSVIGAGSQNSILFDAYNSVISGGYGNSIQSNSNHSVIGGGSQNSIQSNSNFSVIGGGNVNTASGEYSTVPGGHNNTAKGSYSFAAGRRAWAIHPGSFVWADSQDANLISTATNQFSIRASGGVRLNDDTSLFCGVTTRQMLNLWGDSYGIGIQDLTLYQRVQPGAGYAWFSGGVHTNIHNNAGPGGTVLMTLGSSGLTVNGTFVSSSDRNVKENFAPVNSRTVLAQVIALPLSEWNYKQDNAIRHLGPMAQDFYAAFNVGPDDKHIATVDADGVALAAIQGLNQKVDAEVLTLRAENAKLRQRLETLERFLPKGGAN